MLYYVKIIIKYICADYGTFHYVQVIVYYIMYKLYQITLWKDYSKLHYVDIILIPPNPSEVRLGREFFSLEYLVYRSGWTQAGQKSPHLWIKITDRQI